MQNHTVVLHIFLAFADSAREQNANNTLALQRKTSRSTLLVEVETFAVRAAFSHIPLWQALMEVGCFRCVLIRLMMCFLCMAWSCICGGVILHFLALC